MVWNDAVDSTINRIKGRRGKPPDLPIHCLPQLNKNLWGIPKGDLTIIGARPSMGKTALAINFIRDWLIERKNIQFFSWDDSQDRLIKRLISLHGQIDNSLIRDGKIGKIPSDAEAINGLKNILIKEHFYCTTKRGRTIDDFERLVKQPNHIDCVVVDYLQLTSIEGYRSEREAFNAFLRKAKDLAQERNCGMIILSQMSRDSAIPDNKGRVRPPMMSEIKGTGRAEQDADLILLLHWPYKYHKNPELDHPNDYWIKIEKSKDGDPGEVHHCWYYGKYYKFQEAPMEGEHVFYEPKK